MHSKSAAFLVLASMTTLASAQSWGVWQSEGVLPTNGEAKTHSIGLESDGYFYVLGGTPWMNPQSLEDGTVYSRPIGGTAWTEEIGFDGYGYVLGQGGGVDILGRIIIFGGDNPDDLGSFDKPPFEWNSIEGPWHDHAARGVNAPAMNFAFCTDANSRIYSIGGGPGENASAGNPNSTYSERYIGNQETWEPISPMPFGVANAAASPDGLGHILVFGGISADGFSRINTVLQYDIATNSWSASANAPMPVALSDHEATLGADGRVYILGGSSGVIGTETVEQSVHVYDPKTDQWAVGPDMGVARRHFASFLGSDDRIYTIGGDNLSGGSNSVDSIYTTPCPVFTAEPIGASLWRNGTINLGVQTTGGGTITYQWMHDGQPIVDGASVGGGTIAGADTATLNIVSTGAADAGVYSVVATNACGSTSSGSATVTIQIPPAIPQQWVWASLHPSYANHSYAYGVDNGIQVGTAKFDTPEYLNLDHPTRWEGTAISAVNLTPSGSQGGNITDFAGDKLVGWWWAPIQCYVNHQWQTCYFRRGARWDLDGNFYETNYSGYEYTTMNATDGVSIVGSGSTDDDVGNVFTKAVIWQPSAFEFAQQIHPAGYSDSYLTAVDGGQQFGAVNLPFAVVHAGMWSGSGASFVDMHPAGFSNSTIADASDGQQVGTVNIWNNPHGVMWAGTPESMIDLHPDGAISSNLTGCEGGVQIGTTSFDDGLGVHPGVWAGSSESFVDLSSVVPEGYLGFNMAAIDVAVDGTIQIVGNSWNFDLGRAEAILITSTTANPCPADLSGDGTLDIFDVLAFLDAFNSGDPLADFAADGAFDIFDVLAFLDAFNAGCP